jgi:hypothetical protein
MKYRNKIFTVALLISLCTTFSACNNWFDVQPKSQVEDSELFTSQQGYKEALSGAYSSMVTDATYTKEMLFGTMDILAQVWENYPSSYSSLVDYQYSSSLSENIIAKIWSKSYNSIANINNLINHIDADKKLFSNNNYSIIKGEAIALRAFLHFDLLRSFGVSYAVNPSMPAIPYCTDLTYKVFPQLKVQEVAAKIEADLLAAAELLKVDPVYTKEKVTELNDNGYLMNRQVHLNYYAVKGLLARLYMWMQQYDKAAICAQEVIDSKVFSFSEGSDMQHGYDYAFAPEQLFALNDLNLSTLSNTYFNEEYNSTSFSLSSSKLLDYYDSHTEDYRYIYLFKSGTTGDYIDYRYLSKYDASSSEDSYYTNKIPLIRLSEMYLILSECAYRTSGSGLVKLNELRVARNLPELETEPNDYYLELIKEYRREFIGEGQLFFLYKRLNRPSVIGSDADMIGEKAYTFPIPLSETDATQRENNR